MKKYLDLDSLMGVMYKKIAIWHNNPEGLSDKERERELKWVCIELVEEVARELYDDPKISLKIDKNAIV